MGLVRDASRATLVEDLIRVGVIAPRYIGGAEFLGHTARERFDTLAGAVARLGGDAPVGSRGR